MKTKLNQLEDTLLVEKTQLNCMLLLEMIERKQQTLPQLKVVTITNENYLRNTPVLMCKIYLNGEYASKATYVQFADYINANNPS